MTLTVKEGEKDEWRTKRKRQWRQWRRALLAERSYSTLLDKNIDVTK